MIATMLALAAATPVAHMAEPRIADLFDDRVLAIAPPAPPPPEAAGPVVVLLRWPAGTGLAIEPDDDALVLRYDRPLDEARVEAFSQAAGPRIERLDWGPDNLVLAARADLRLSARIVPEGVELTFAPRAPATARPDSATPDDAPVLAAQADAAAGYPARARRRLACLAAARPDDPALRASLASADYASGRIEDAARGFAALPDGGGAAGRVARRAIGPAVESAVLSRNGRGFDQTEVSLRAGSPVSGAARIEGAVRHVRTRGDDPAGTPARLERNVSEAGLSLAARLADDLRLRLDLTSLLDDDVTGAALTTAWGTPERRAALRLAWHLPDLVTPTGALAGGWMDRALVGGALRPLPGVSLRLEGGIMRYGLAGQARTLSTALVEARIEYLVRRQSPALTLGYRMEGEYILDRHAPGPDPYATLTDRENHSVEATVSQPIRNLAILTAAAGWTVSRFGDGGPTGALGLSLIPVDGWEGSVQAGISSISRPGQPNRQTFGRLGLTKRFAAAAR